MKKIILNTSVLLISLVMLSACQKTAEKKGTEQTVTSETKAKKEAFTEEELIAAFYLDSFIDKKDEERNTLEKVYTWLVEEHPGEVHFQKEEEGYVLDYSTKGSRLHFKVTGDTIEQRGEYDDSSKVLQTFTKAELAEKYQEKRHVIKEFLAISKNNQKVAEKNAKIAEEKEAEEAKKQLSDDQIITWVKKAIAIRMGQSADSEKINALDYNIFKANEKTFSDSDPSLVHIGVAIPQADTIGVFRITSDGVLESHESQSGNGLTDMIWVPVSDSYLDMAKGEAYYASRQPKKSQVDTKNLTADQAITWVKNALQAKGASAAEVSEAEFQSQMSDDGYLTINMYTWNMAHTFKTIAYTYRINSSGELQEKNVYNAADTWETISTEYIEG